MLYCLLGVKYNKILFIKRRYLNLKSIYIKRRYNNHNKTFIKHPNGFNCVTTTQPGQE